MRRKDQPSLPKAIICCRLSSLNTLLMTLQASLPCSAVNVPDDFFYMAGFEVTLYGRFWVTPEAPPIFLQGEPLPRAGREKTLRL